MSGYGTMVIAAVGSNSQAGKIMLMTRGQQIQTSAGSGSESEASEMAASENQCASATSANLQIVVLLVSWLPATG